MDNTRHIGSQEIGLVIGLILGKYLLKTEDLHYGLWTEGMEVTPENLPRAQENHSRFIISHIPEGTKKILDVGCGMGALAQKLLAKGYEVDLLSPSPLLTKKVRENLGNGERIFECGYEQLETDRRYDLVLFSESFQYVKLEKSLGKTMSILNNGGHLMICDFFKTDAKVKSALGGGHSLSGFYRKVSSFPLKPVSDIDITKETAPNLALVNDLLQNVGVPIRDLIFYTLDNNHPRLARFIKWKFKKKIEKLDHKYFSGERNAQAFAVSKSYRLLLYQKQEGPAPA
jgi:SAM-dependent methyltransferase